ncbi:MFS transporter [Streptomyces lichenis]|uniref:MFS transporter n=1 Tax=Streptomyces lichenis TaxID=2306967 RepID=A0ABT0I9Z1_9ACTN|nr:MFS transporter [Streptomyces lichenis]MCK8678123.1 MFS transporter [Streptomyces lichenis]
MSQRSSRVPRQNDSAASSASTAPATYRAVLAVREFRMIFLAQVIATLGNVVAQITLSIMVYQRTQSPLLSSLTFALGFAPYVLGATLLSAVADRYPARDVMVACQAVSCAVVGTMAVPGMPIPVLLVLLLVLGTVAPVFQGARAASLPDLLSGSGYALGRSLLRLVSQSTQIIGFAVGGLLLLVVTSSQALLAAAAGFGLAALLLRFGTRRRASREPEGGTQGSVARASLSGVRQVLAVPGLRPLLLLTWLPPAFAVAPEALAAPYADELGGGPAAVGLLLCAAPAGSVVGELLAGTLLTARTRVRMVLPTALLMFLPLLGFAFRPGLWASVALLTVCGLGFTYAMGLDQRVLDATPEELRGRALTIMLAGLMITQGLGFAAAGAVAEFLPPPVVIVIVGSLGLLTLAWCGVSMRPRKDRQATRPPVADQAA